MKTKKMEHKKVCMMAFNPTEYTTELNGDVWIFGTPLFYEFTAHYDRGDGKEKVPPASKNRGEWLQIVFLFAAEMYVKNRVGWVG